MMRKLVLAFGVTSVIFLLHPQVFSEYVSESVKGGDTKHVEYKNVVDYEYQIWVGAMDRWKFDGSFDISAGYIGWYKGTDSERLKVAKTVSSMLLFAPTVFPVTMSGRIIPTDEGEGPPPPTDWTVQVAEGEGEATIDPATAIVAIGDSQTYTYKLNGAAFNAYWFYPDGWSSSMSSTFNFPPVSAYSPEHFTIQARLNTLNQGAASAEAWYVGIESISGGGITSTTSDPGPEQTIIVLKGSPAITFVAQKAPQNAPAWPENYPTWSPGNSQGESYIFDTNTAGEYVLTANCGIDAKAVKIAAVEVNISVVNFAISQSPPDGSPVIPSKISTGVMIETVPQGHENLVALLLSSGPGSLTKTSDTEWLFVSEKETKGVPPANASAISVVKPQFKSIALEISKTIVSHCVFEYFYSKENDYEKAWQYAKWKYSISTSYLSSISYDPSLVQMAITEMSTPKYARTMKLGKGAFVDENVCASTLVHENVHGGQDSKLTGIDSFILYYSNEREAYWTELMFAPTTKIPESYFDITYNHYTEFGGDLPKPQF